MIKLNRVNIVRNGLKPVIIPAGLVLLQDTREQQPLFDEFHPDLVVENTALNHGDYSINGFQDKFAIERKKISDFYSYIGRERHRTIKKMEAFRDMVSAGGFAGLVIEATEGDLLTGFIMSRVSPETARQALVSFEVRYRVHIYYSSLRSDIARWILDRAIKFYKVQREVRIK